MEVLEHFLEELTSKILLHTVGSTYRVGGPDIRRSKEAAALVACLQFLPMNVSFSVAVVIVR